MAERDFTKEAKNDAKRDTASRRWFRARVEQVHRSITAYDVLSRNGVELRYSGQRPEQIFCPFHGNTRTMAARYHPAEGGSRDHVWCFVCQKQWDAINLWQKFHSIEGSFGRVIADIERAYGIRPPEGAPEVDDYNPDEEVHEKTMTLLEVCESRLRRARGAFDMHSFLKIGVVLDRLRHQLGHGTVAYSYAKDVLEKALDRIGEKERAPQTEVENQRAGDP